MAASPVRVALYNRLVGDATLVALLATATSVFHRRAPRDAASPYITFHKQAGTPSFTFGPVATRIDSEMWTVKAVDRNPSAAAAETIAARIDVVLTDAPLTVTGARRLLLRPESSIDYAEHDGADQWVHVGAIYRLILQPT